MRPTRWIGMVAVTGAVAISGCGGGSDDSSSSSGSSGASGGSSQSSSSSTSSGSGGGQTIKLAADPNGKLVFDKSRLTAKAGRVTIDFTNSSGVPHAVEIEGHGIEKETETITNGANSLTADLEPGTYEFYCPVDGHRQAGMKGTLVVK